MRRIGTKLVPTITKTGIYGFFDNYRWLSNFHLCEISLQGLKYPSSEHAYQAMKTIRTKDRKMVRDAPTPNAAKHMGQEVPLRAGWDDMKMQKMEEVLRCKFLQNTYLRILLDTTNDLHLEETNYWGDTFWGVCNGVGENNLGKLLMKLRAELR